jgi:hypothetical protein
LVFVLWHSSVRFGFCIAVLLSLSLPLPWESEPRHFSWNWHRILTSHIHISLDPSDDGFLKPPGLILGHFWSHQPDWAPFRLWEVVMRFFESINAIGRQTVLIPVSHSTKQSEIHSYVD